MRWSNTVGWSNPKTLPKMFITFLNSTCNLLDQFQINAARSLLFIDKITVDLFWWFLSNITQLNLRFHKKIFLLQYYSPVSKCEYDTQIQRFDDDAQRSLKTFRPTVWLVLCWTFSPSRSAKKRQHINTNKSYKLG